MGRIVGRFDELTRLVDDVNQRFRVLSGGVDLLPPTSLPLQSDDVPEAGFLRLVSWLWSQYHETGRVTLETLTSVPSVTLQANDHLRESALLRTYLQHHLDVAVADDRRKAEQATSWFTSHCGRTPQDDADWISLVEHLSGEAEGLMRELGAVIGRLASTDLSSQFRRVLQMRLDRTVPAHEVDDMIDSLKPLYGLDYLDTRAFRDRNYQSWRERTRLLTADRDARSYLRELIEQALSRHVEAEPAPLSGEEIMDIFGIRPGPEVGRLKRRAEELSSTRVRSKGELIEVLAEETGMVPAVAIDDL